MNLTRIETYQELKKFIGPLRSLHATLDGKWEPDLDEDDFITKLINFHDPDNYYFGELSEENEVIYFAALITDIKPKAYFWLFFMNKRFRTETQKLLFDMSDYMIARGYHIIYSRTGRTEKSYERWLSKFGAQKIEVVYKFNLNNLQK